MLIDCDLCAMQGTEVCEDCVVTAILREGPLDLDDEEVSALEFLADAGLAPRLRLVPRPPPERPEVEGVEQVG